MIYAAQKGSYSSTSMWWSYYGISLYLYSTLKLTILSVGIVLYIALYDAFIVTFFRVAYVGSGYIITLHCRLTTEVPRILDKGLQTLDTDKIRGHYKPV